LDLTAPATGAQASSAGMERGRASVAHPGWVVVCSKRPGDVLVSRTEHARDRRIAAPRRWIVDAADRAR
jgi:hypothetical protein